MKIINTQITRVKEKLKAPFGFKGGFLSELWQVVAKIETENAYGVGVGVQSVLWCDANVFSLYSEEDGNAIMYMVSKKALELLNGKEGENPIDIIDSVYDDLLAFSKTITILKEDLRETFVKNALVCVDNALWQAYARERKETNFLSLIPSKYLPALSEKHEKLSNIPLISYGVSREEIKCLLDTGTVLLKIKIGYDNGGKLSKEEMLNWDKNRFNEIHQIAKEYKTEYTYSNKILYYLDANGRYDNLDRLQSFIDYAKEIGALEQIVLLEEPFEEFNKIDVSSLPCRIAADESIHSLKDVEERINLGYKAVTLKPIAKTLSETLKILKCATEKGVVCFCADLTVNPLLVEWNKNIASRIKTIPEMKIGILESNGEQNYVNWDLMCSYEPLFIESFAKCVNGIYTLNKKFFETSGGIFLSSYYYDNLFKI
ncbi:MAG: L-alanine-DL-glutamate epimerase [Clostridia bacterium]|nr:L-alanine-DL-glutamate epimerase [Clostridia bacterium]